MTDTSKKATDAICHKIIRHVADGMRWGSDGDLAGVIDTIRALSAERDALLGDNRILRTEKHADAEAIATRRDINAENDRLTRRGMKKFTTIKGGKPAIAHAADMCEAVKSAVYDFADKVPLATAIGVLAIAQREILDEQE